MASTRADTYVATPRNQRHGFGGFVLDLSRGALLRDGIEIPLRKQAFDMLSLLVLHQGELIGKDRLMSEIWGDAVVTENSITQCLKEIRHAIGDHELNKIRTIPRRGYILELPVSAVGDELESGHPARSAFSKWTWGLVVVLAIVVLAWWAQIDTPSSSSDTAEKAVYPPPHSIAVVPFMNLSAAPENFYLADAVSEEILNQLVQFPDLLVIARTSSFKFRAGDTTIATIGEQLNVAHVLEGSVRVDDDMVRVIAQLVETGNQAQRWSRSYDRPLDSMFALLEEIAAEVAAELNVELLGKSPANSRSRHKPSMEAYKAVVEGQTYYQRRGEGDAEKAVALFEQATELDPEYALAWARLAAAIYILYEEADEIPFDEMMRRGTMAASRAMELDPDIVEAPFRAARYAYLSGDRKRHRALFQRAVELAPRNPLVLGAMAGAFFDRGDLDKALELEYLAVEQDPLSGIERFRLSSMLYYAGRFEEMWREFEVGKRLNPALADNHTDILVAVHLLQGNWEAARSLVDSVEEESERHKFTAMLLKSDRLSQSGASSLSWLESETSFQSSIILAEVWAFLEEPTRALDCLDEAAERFGSGELDDLELHALLNTHYSHFLKPLHGDPRWEQWLAFVKARQF